MRLITFDCKHCGAPLEIPENAVAVICEYCNSQHKVAVSNGVVTAELVETVRKQGERISSLENSVAINEELLKASTALGTANQELADFDRRYGELPERHDGWGWVFTPPAFFIGMTIATDGKWLDGSFIPWLTLAFLGVSICGIYGVRSNYTLHHRRKQIICRRDQASEFLKTHGK